MTASVRNYADVLRAARGEERYGYTFLDRALEAEFWSFERIVVEAERRARYLRHFGLIPGDHVALILQSSREFVLSFFGAVLAGGVPVPLYPPGGMAGTQTYYEETTVRALRVSGAAHVITGSAEREIVFAAVARDPELARVRLVVVEDMAEETQPWPAFEPYAAQPDDTCFLQFTSGSTKEPKGVVVTHLSLIANCRAMLVDAIRTDRTRDRGVSWLPLYHDMGLVGFVLAPMLVTTDVVFIPTTAFVRRPQIWMATVSKYRGTITFAPNFAFALAAKRGAREPLDLSRLRVLGCGAEPIRASVMEQFYDVFAPHGLQRAALMPSYGLAEATLAVAFDQDGLHILHVDAESYEVRRQLELRPGPAPDTVELVSCGRALPMHEVAVLDPDGKTLPDGAVGEIAVRGPSVTTHYFENPDATRELFRGHWMRTGDLGAIWESRLYVTGRSKDVIKIKGRSLDPQSLEWEVEQLDGVRSGNVVVFAVSKEGEESVVVVAEASQGTRTGLALEIRERLRRSFGLSLADVVFVRPGELPKTTSGKVRRAPTRLCYLNGEYA
jgi:fatty-acyl-CoA synthase